MKPVKVGLLGLGTVGGGTVSVLSRNAEEIARRAGRGIQISHAAAKISLPCMAIKALFAVTTCLPLLIASKTSSFAGE